MPGTQEVLQTCLLNERINKKLDQAALSWEACLLTLLRVPPISTKSGFPRLGLTQTQLLEADNPLAGASGAESAPGNSECQKYIEKVL